MIMNPENWKFCPRCGESLLIKPAYDGKERPTCEACGFIYFADPKVTAGVLVEDERGCVLLGRRSVDPRRGYWTIPSGYVDYGESPNGAAHREFKEETGLDVTLTGLLGLWTFDDDIGDKVGIAIFYRGSLAGGTLQPADDIDEAGWFAPDALPDRIAFPVHEEILEAWRRGQLEILPLLRDSRFLHHDEM